MKGHRWFAAIYDRMMASDEKKFFGAILEEMLRGVGGDVVEIGAGTGANFPYYQNSARVIATDPDPYMLQRARTRAAAASVSIELREAAAEELPFDDDAFDFVIATLVLCSVRDPRMALAEVRRVLKPGGELRLYEHVRYQNPIGGLAQDVISPVWQWFGAGCRPNRDTAGLLSESGFELLDVKMRKEGPPVPPMVFTRPQLQVVARRPA